MKKKTAKIAFIAYAALFLLLTKVRQVVNGLQFRFNGLQVLSTFAGGNVSQLRLNLLLRNPLPFTVTINDIVGKLYIQGVRASSYENDIDLQRPIEIKGRSITPVSLDFYVSWGNAMEAVKQNILSGDISSFTAQFVGKITAEGRTFNVSKTLSYYDLV